MFALPAMAFSSAVCTCARRSESMFRVSTSRAMSALPAFPSRTRRAKAALARLMRPSAVTVAIPNGADWKKRAKRTSAVLPFAPGSSSARRSSTAARKPPSPRGTTSSVAGQLRPSSRTRSRSIRPAPFVASRARARSSIAPSPEIMSVRTRPRARELALSPSHVANVPFRCSMVASSEATMSPMGIAS